MSILNSDLLLGQEGGSGAYEVSRSLRFNSSDSAYLSRTPASAGNRKTWTWAGWYKRTSPQSSLRDSLLSTPAGGDDSTLFNLIFLDDAIYVAGSVTGWRRTSAVFRDPSSWYHIVLAVDTTQATANNRIRLYVNGSEVTAFATLNNPSQNADLGVNNNALHNIGNYGATYLNGYLADVHLVDGQALDPTSFTEVDATTGQLVPKAYTGTYGTNGFHLPFSDNSTAAALGTDTSGNGNTWTVNNITASVNPVYSNFTTNTTNPKNAFDGSLSTSASNSGDPANPMVFSSLALTGVTTFEYYTTDGGTYDVAVNGGSFSTDAGGSGWRSLSSPPSTITSVSLKNTAGSPNTAVVRAFRVNSVVLVDGVPSNIDSLVDTPSSGSQVDTGLGGQVTGNYATLNPLATGFGSNNQAGTLANGNLDWSTASTTYFANAVSTIAPKTGKYYVETICQNASYSGIGFVNAASISGITGNYGLGAPSDGWFRQGTVVNNNTSNAVTGMTALAVGDIVGLALDLDNGKAWWSKNGAWHNSGDPASGTNATVTFTPGGKDWLIGLSLISPASAQSINFGQRQWAYAAPSGFRPIVDTLLPSPVVAKPSEVMDVKLYTGNGSTQTISGLGFSPDLVWIKSRGEARNHRLTDTIRGATKALKSDATDAEVTNATGLTAFNADGFDLGDDTAYNNSGFAYVAWTWDAGSSTVTNTQGSISSQVRANASAGFSIVTYTGNGSSGTVGHGLGVAPSMVLIKNRSVSQDWAMWFSGLTVDQYFYLNSTDGIRTFTGSWGALPTSSLFSTFTTHNNTNNYVAYCFAPVAGYSSFGSYTGNGSASDGPFIYTGFKPRFFVFKRTDTTGQWVVVDTARSPYNPAILNLNLNLSDSEYSGYATEDFVSNGLKLRTSDANWNASGGTYVYFAFASNPFQYSRAG